MLGVVVRDVPGTQRRFRGAGGGYYLETKSEHVGDHYFRLLAIRDTYEGESGAQRTNGSDAAARWCISSAAGVFSRSGANAD